MPEFLPRTDSAALDTERVLRALDVARVDYVLIGGVACIAHGAEQLTFDTDILPSLDPDNLDRLLGALESLGAGIFVDDARLAMEAGELWETISLRGGGAGLGDAEAWHFSTDAGLVDVVMRAAGVGDFDAHVDNARQFEVFGLSVKVAGLDELVRSKETLGRAKDLPVLEQLRGLHDAG
ncbi:MAG: hypothetical protein QOG90_2270 [Actinomycetota bacterium]